ncbi:MAG: LTA synthase family protein [Alphaproteobacteria bacterium]|nr:LTA synthase family protein [Alphaproteobacteria bacterium]
MKNIFAQVFIFFVLIMYCLYTFVDINFDAYSPREIVFGFNISIDRFDSYSLKIFFLNVFLPALFLWIFLFFIPRIIKLIKRSFNVENCRFYIFILFCFLFIEGLYLYNKRFEICKTLFNQEYSDFYEKNYVESKKENIEFPEKKKNLIFISLESIERSFADKDVYGASLIEDLEKLEQGEVYFKTYQDGFDTVPTEPSIMAVFNGLPATFLSKLHFGQVIPFPKSYSLGKILQDEGYFSKSIIGSDGNFTGFHQFLDHHGVQNHIDKKDIKKLYPDETPNHFWGYSDETVLKVLKDEIIKASAQKQPFFFLIKTADTHGDDVPDVLIRKKFGIDMLDLINNTSFVTAEFVNWFKTRPEYKDTVLVIAGDHFRASKVMPFPVNPSIYNLFINSVVKPKNTDRTFTQIDMFPTILEAMGVKIKGHRLGLGTSVFSDEPTLAERFSPEYLAKELVKQNKIYESLW